MRESTGFAVEGGAESAAPAEGRAARDQAVDAIAVCAARELAADAIGFEERTGGCATNKSTESRGSADKRRACSGG